MGVEGAFLQQIPCACRVRSTVCLSMRPFRLESACWNLFCVSRRKWCSVLNSSTLTAPELSLSCILREKARQNLAMHWSANSKQQRCDRKSGSHLIILFARFKEKCKPPNAKALCNSSASSCPLLSTSIALNHCAITAAESGRGLNTLSRISYHLHKSSCPCQTPV